MQECNCALNAYFIAVNKHSQVALSLLRALWLRENVAVVITSPRNYVTQKCLIIRTIYWHFRRLVRRLKMAPHIHTVYNKEYRTDMLV
jgi:hypothetical protein